MTDHDIEICSLGEVRGKITEFKPHITVSALRQTTDITNALHIPIDDIYLAQLAPYKGAIRTVLELDEPRILIHCRHGQSRSAALALAKVYQRGGEPAVTRWLEDHPEAQPNPLILFLADDLLGAEGELMWLCRDIYKGKKL